MAEHAELTEVVILRDDDGSEVVAERRSGGLIEVITRSSLGAARAWIEAPYEDVEWRKPRLAIASTGRLSMDCSELDPKSQHTEGGDDDDGSAAAT